MGIRIPARNRVSVLWHLWASWTKVGVSAGILLFSFGVTASRTSSGEPVTITFLDPERSQDRSERSAASDETLQEFTRQTGIRMKHLPAPESSPDQLGLTRQLMRKADGSPDVYGIDLAGEQYLADLKPYFAKEAASDEPALVTKYTVNGKLVAFPYHTNTGVLFYRADLLKQYGYREPPRTWDQLEKMALRIQQESAPCRLRKSGRRILGSAGASLGDDHLGVDGQR